VSKDQLSDLGASKWPPSKRSGKRLQSRYLTKRAGQVQSAQGRDYYRRQIASACDLCHGGCAITANKKHRTAD